MGEKINKQLCIIGIGDAGVRPAQILSKRAFIPGAFKFMMPDMRVQAVIPPDLDALLRNDFHFVLFAGLGSYTSTRLLSAIVGRLSKECKTLTCIVSYPFRFEGLNRLQIADLFVLEFGKHKWVKLLRLDDLRRHGNLILSDAFEYADLSLAQMANKELGLNLTIELPRLSKPNNQMEERVLKLEALSKKMVS